MLKPARSVSSVPSAFVVGGVQLISAEPVAAGPFTVRSNAARDAVALPSLTEMTMPDVVPASPAAGVPESLPVVVLNVAHAGVLLMLNVMVSPSASAADGVKL